MPACLPSWHLLGLGAVGGGLAAYWLENQQSLRVILKKAGAVMQLQAKEGLHFIHGTEEKEKVFSVAHLKPTLPHKLTAPIEHLLLTVKAYDVLAALASIAHCLTDETQIYCFQNGLGILEQIQALYPQCTLYPVVATLGVCSLSPYHVKQSGEGHFWVGPWPPVKAHRRGERLKGKKKPDALLNVFQQAGLVYTWTEDIRSAQWQKLAVNCVINPLTVIYYCTNGALLNRPEAKHLIKHICGEVAQVMAALEIPHGDEATLQQLVFHVIKETAANHSSMWQDNARGRPTEIDYLNGFLVDIAEDLGIAVPYNARITRVIRGLEEDPML